jgi:micrococcal nuclease
MRKLLPILILVACLSACTASDLPSRSGHVIGVHDGDTITLRSDITVRLLGIDCPEPGAPYADAATKLTHDLVLWKDVRIETDKEQHDAYGRLLAYVYVEGPLGWEMVNLDLIEAGLAMPCYIAPNGKHRAEFDAMLHDAINGHRGLWSGDEHASGRSSH